jgi:hypothetical protein
VFTHQPALLGHGQPPMSETQYPGSTPEWDRAPADLVRLLRLAGYPGPWPDSVKVDGLAWPDVMASINNHAAMWAIETLYRLPGGLPPSPLRLPRVQPAELTSRLWGMYPPHDTRRHCWTLGYSNIFYCDSPGPGVAEVLRWNREQIAWCLLLPVFDELLAGTLIMHGMMVTNDDYALRAARPGLWKRPDMMLDLNSQGSFWSEKQGLKFQDLILHRTQMAPYSDQSSAVPPAPSEEPAPPDQARVSVDTPKPPAASAKNATQKRSALTPEMQNEILNYRKDHPGAGYRPICKHLADQSFLPSRDAVKNFLKRDRSGA